MFSIIEAAISTQAQKCDIPTLDSDSITQLRVGGGVGWGDGVGVGWGFGKIRKRDFLGTKESILLGTIRLTD